jgi:hypothetical protein
MQGFTIYDINHLLEEDAKNHTLKEYPKEDLKPSNKGYGYHRSTDYYRDIFNKIIHGKKCRLCKGKIVFNEWSMCYCLKCKKDYYIDDIKYIILEFDKIKKR